MRRKQCAVTDPEKITAILGQSRVGRLATNGVDGYPYITPLNYVYYNNSIYFHCARAGEKLDNIERDPRVCFEVDIPLAYLPRSFDPERPACAVTQYYHSVVIRGRAERIDDLEEKIAALNALMAAHEEDPHFDEITAETKAVSLCEVVAVRVESLSAKSELSQNKDTALKNRIADFLEQRGLPGDLVAAELIRVDEY